VTTSGDLAFVVALFVGPPVALITCLLLRGAGQPRWVFAAAAALSAVMVLAWVAYWYLWGKAFEYADTNRPVPPALDRGSDLAIAVCCTASVMVAALGASRLVAASRAVRLQPETGT